jgi:predicted membrane metal-binding protein
LPEAIDGGRPSLGSLSLSLSLVLSLSLSLVLSLTLALSLVLSLSLALLPGCRKTQRRDSGKAYFLRFLCQS